MNSKILGILLLLMCQLNFAQTASTYFPSQTGYKWNYESVPLDSLNNPVNSQKFFSIDSFAVQTTFNGKNANVVLSKTGAQNTINFQPYLDTLYYNFESSNGFEYFDPELVSGLLGNIDSTLGINFFNFFGSLEGWYSYYRFASNVNASYQIYQKDTTIIIDGTSLPVRFELIGKRLADETINTAIGTFICKKFLLERRLSYLILNIFPVKILGVEETVWLAQENWKVKSYVPSTNVDLSIVGIPKFNIPGLETNIIAPITDVEDEFLAVDNFELYQNYPNPFNPSTKISWQSPVGDHQSLKIYDVLGNEVAKLVDEYREAGKYEVEFNPESSIKNFPAGRQGTASGVYFYQLTIGNIVQSKKMLMIK